MKDQVVLIAGASGGIGEACSRLFAEEGAKVVLAARNSAKAETIADEINDAGGEAIALELDVTDQMSVTNMLREVDETYGRIDVLVNAFGLGMIQPLTDAHPDEIKDVLDANVYGTILITQAVIKQMEPQKSGKIIMYPGILGKAVMRHSSIYSASKFAVTGFTKALVEENKRSGIRFSLMFLGGVATDFWENPNVGMKVQKDKMLTPEEVAKATLYACNQQGASVLNELVIQPESHQMV